MDSQRTCVCVASASTLQVMLAIVAVTTFARIATTDQVHVQLQLEVHVQLQLEVTMAYCMYVM